MPACKTILLASTRSGLAMALRREIMVRRDWRLVGPVDPRDTELLASASAMANISLIEGKDLLWILNNRPEAAPAALGRAFVVVIPSGADQLLAVTARMQVPHGLVLRRLTDKATVGCLALAIEGYTALPGSLVRRLMTNQLRLDMIENLTPELLTTLACLGEAFSNSKIAGINGMTESRVKTLVHTLIRKLRLANRTAIAVFAATNGLTHGTSNQPIYYTSGKKAAFQSAKSR